MGCRTQTVFSKVQKEYLFSEMGRNLKMHSGVDVDGEEQESEVWSEGLDFL